MDLTESELTGLRWSRTCNELGIGFLGPTVRRHGELPAYGRLVSRGLLTCMVGRDNDASGYFITAAGRAAIPAR